MVVYEIYSNFTGKLMMVINADYCTRNNGVIEFYKYTKEFHNKPIACISSEKQSYRIVDN